MKNFAKLITNPSFQTTTLSSSTQYVALNNQASATTYIPGWTLVSGSVEIQGTYDGSAANNTVDLYGQNAPGEIAQTVTTVIGETYYFDFQAVAAQDGGGNPAFEILINGVGIIATGQVNSVVYPPSASSNQTSTTQMQTYRYEFTATSTSTTLSIAHRGTQNPNGTGVFTDGIVPYVACFMRGSYLETDIGEIKIEDLKIGDLVKTVHHGLQPIRWIGSQKIEGKGKFAPILFKKHAVNNSRDLMVSPQHRMFVDNAFNELYFGDSEKLIVAKHMVNGKNIFQVEMDEVEYFHVLFDHHEIVYSSGAQSESFHPGKENLEGLSQETRNEIFEIFPKLAKGYENYGPMAAGVLLQYEAVLFRKYGISLD